MTEPLSVDLSARRLRKLASDIVALAADEITPDRFRQLQTDAKTALENLPRGRGKSTATENSRLLALKARRDRYEEKRRQIGPLILEMRGEMNLSYAEISASLLARGYKPERADRYPVQTLRRIYLELTACPTKSSPAETSR